MSVSDGYPQIDWRRLLGPIVSQSGSSASTAIAVDELADLQRATWNHSRRAVRPRMDLPTTELPFDSQAVPWFPRGRFVGSAAVRSEVSSLGTAEISADLATHLAPRSVSQLVRPGSFMHYAAGDYYIQDAGSMLALALCAGVWQSVGVQQRGRRAGSAVRPCVRLRVGRRAMHGADDARAR